MSGTARYPVQFFFTLLGLVMLLVAGLASYPAQATSFTWSGQPRPTLTNTSPLMLSAPETLSGLTWSVTDPTVAQAPVTALIAPGSSLVGVEATSATKLSNECGFDAIGTINFAAVTFGPGDRLDTTNRFPPPSGLDGIDGAVVGLLVDLTADGFKTQGPVVQNSMIFTFDITGGSQADAEIAKVQPLFGSTSATQVPAPSTLLLVGSGLVGLGILGRRRWGRR